MFMKHYIRPVLVLAMMISVSARADSPMNSVVKVFAVHAPPDYSKPWQNLTEFESTSSGCVIEGNRILTVAHSVYDHAFVTVRKQSSPHKYPARVVACGVDCDLAILTVDAPGFFDDLEPLSLVDELPALQEKVVVLGYPTGGDSVSLTEGVVSRFEMQNYDYSWALLPVMQVDAAVNPGNSGGPVLINNKLAGIAFQGLNESQNIAYAIPPPVIRHFLETIESDGEPGRLGWMGIAYQVMENEQIRAFKEMTSDQTGILITGLTHAFEHQALMPGDVLMALDRVPIANNGTVSLRKQERIQLSYLLADKSAGDIVSLQVMRDGVILDLQMPLQTRDRLVPWMQHNISPGYFIHAGIVFVPLSWDYMMASTGGNIQSAGPELLNFLVDGSSLDPAAQVVVLSSVLMDEVNMGYETFRNLVVSKVNGEPILNLKDLAARIEANEEPYLILEFRSQGLMVLETARARAASERILKNYRIPADRSDDLEDLKTRDSDIEQRS